MSAPPAVQEKKERRSRVRTEESSSSWSRCCSAFDAGGGSSPAVRDEEGRPTHSVCGRRSLAPFLDHGGDELQFSIVVYVIRWRRIWCSTVLQTMHFEFGARFESSVEDSLNATPCILASSYSCCSSPQGKDDPCSSWLMATLW
jgi:hypothetical protein